MDVAHVSRASLTNGHVEPLGGCTFHVDCMTLAWPHTPMSRVRFCVIDKRLQSRASRLASIRVLTQRHVLRFRLGSAGATCTGASSNGRRRRKSLPAVCASWRAGRSRASALSRSGAQCSLIRAPLLDLQCRFCRSAGGSTGNACGFTPRWFIRDVIRQLRDAQIELGSLGFCIMLHWRLEI